MLSVAHRPKYYMIITVLIGMLMGIILLHITYNAALIVGLVMYWKKWTIKWMVGQ